MKKSRVIVGMSGGVDSSVAAALLVQQGYDVVGIFMKNWSDAEGVSNDTNCSWEKDAEDARRVASLLSIPFYVLNFEKEYKARVFDYFLREYKAGRTPNPDILCNSEVKFRVFLEYAVLLGAQKIATGHYARVKKTRQRARLYRGIDRTKDQSYFLYRLSQKQLQRATFPLGEMTKKDVRTIAEKMKLPTAHKKDSQGICFVGEVSLKDFLLRYIPKNPGPMVATNGRVLGTHEGLAFYTIGQRRGLPTGGGSGMPYYVVEKKLATNTLVVAKGHEEDLLWKTRLTLTDIHWISGRAPKRAFRGLASVRYRQEPQNATVKRATKHTIEVVFDAPQKSIAEGQSVVLYHGEEVIGGGIITGAA